MSEAVVAPEDRPGADAPEQAQVLRTLVTAQVLSGAGLAAGVTVGALLAEDMLGTDSLAGVPSALFTIGAAGTAVLVGRVSDRRGRRRGLGLGYGIGATGAALVVLAAAIDSVLLLLPALLVYGAGTATNLQARYAGADLAAPERRARAISTVLVATTFGAVVGPNVVSVMGDIAEQVDLPRLAGPFILASAAYAAAGAVLLLRLHPDPLLLARSRAGAAADTAATSGGSPTTEAGPASPWLDRAVAVGASVMVVSVLVMVAVMTMTPVHMEDHGHSLGATGTVISAHIAGMYLPSPISGRLVDAWGPRTVAMISGATLALAGFLAATAPDHSAVALGVALAVLGLGWNLGLVSGTAIVTDAVPIETRARVQGRVDVAVAIAGTGGGLGSGIVVSATSYPTLALVGGAVALALVPVVAAGSRAPTEGTPT